MKKIILLISLFTVLSSSSIVAQIEVGASYELREDDPKSGFGLRVEKGFLEQLPLVSVGLRAHFSFFSDENSVSDGGAVSYSQDLTNYDFGLAVIGGVSVGLIEPYVGLGLGSTTIDIKPKEVQGLSIIPEDENESNIYWNALLGAKVSIIPLVKPFVEYRYSNTSISEPEIVELSTGRIIFGVVFSF